MTIEEEDQFYTVFENSISLFIVKIFFFLINEILKGKNKTSIIIITNKNFES